MKEFLNLTKPVSLYLHIPFCTTKCGYCAFYSLENSKCAKDDKERFFTVISSQLEALVQELRCPFDTVYIGGGNPGLIGAGRINSLLETASRYGKSREVSMEINPETLDESFRTVCEYVTRFSLGIQSFNSRHMQTLTRNASQESVIRALELLQDFRKEKGISFNADLMTNIPFQTLDEALDDIDRLVSYSPDHISLYSLTFEEGTKLIQEHRPKSEEEEAYMLTHLWDHLERIGYEHYEVSAFAKDGSYCKHNLVYWNLGQYIGLGPSAESSAGYSTVVSSREKETLEDYLAHPSFDSIRLTHEEVLEEYLMTVLRTKWGLDKKEFATRFSTDFDSLFSDRIRQLDSSWYEDDKDTFRLTREGVMVMNRVLVTLFLAL